MKHLSMLLLCLLLAGLPNNAFAQQKFTISGYIEDAGSGEKLISANAFDLRSSKGTVSNIYGFYSLTLPKDSVMLTFSYIGYQPQSFKVMLDEDLTFNVKLEQELSLTEVVVVAEELKTIEEQSQMSSIDVPIAQIKKIPALMGETDVLKALQLLPGVQSGGEGQSGLYVRGGSPDQNLILLDGVPVYNASHLFGFFSVFNVDAVKDVKLTKGGFPARYGGRLSSVIEINMKEGNMNEWKGAGSIGLVASRMTVEGPLSENTSVMLSGRRTYIDVLARPFIKRSFEESGSSGVAGYYFYDFNGKINHRFSDKDRLYLSVYTGKDKFYLRETYDNSTNGNRDLSETDIGLGWGNLTSALRWNHLWSNKLFSNLTATYSRYNFNTAAGEKYEFGDERENFSINYLSGIDDVALKMDFDYVPDPDHFIRFGASVINHTFKPGKFDLKVEFMDSFDPFTLDTTLGQANVNAQEYAAYVEDDMKIGDNLKMNVGVHFSAFHIPGKTYTSVQPRLGMRYMLPGRVALKGSFASMRQYVQLLTNEGIGLPTDLWLPTTERVKPQDSWQVGLGLAKTFKKEYEVSIEAYYKEMKNLLSYKEGSSLFQLNDWQDNVTQGDGQSYGLEFLVQKKKGRFSGWVGYTLSWSWREFEELNLGRRYPFKYDRRHDISIVASYEISKRINIAGTWVYGTGNALTLANSKYNGLTPELSFPNRPFVNQTNLEHYENRNNFRMRSYHRFDFGINLVKEKKRWTRTWSFGAYNVYNRNNPFFLFTSDDTVVNDNGNFVRETQLKQASLFPVIPYFSYNIEF
ncbi:MAG: carboxypeptidase-like regulatory domain-containing protein [Saprospiraceae bacterium]